MATRARIGYETAIGSFVTSYHHWDGYPSELGWNLIKNYNNPRKLMLAVSLGDASNWGSKISPDGLDHTFDNPEENVNVYYGRDRGENNTGPTSYASWTDLTENWNSAGEEYAYVLRMDNTWTMIAHDNVIHDAEDDIVLARARFIDRVKTI